MRVCVLLLCILANLKDIFGDSYSDFSNVNNDGSFDFGLSNDDVGGHFHSAKGSRNKVVRGRFGSRNPSNGRIEETEYTAGPRGFRARGPNIHRKMDLSQVPRGPIGSIDDPLADPYEDPSYNFEIKTPEYQKKENADSSGRVRGLYSYLDDIGERHTVRYAAGQETGFEVLNTIPDSVANVRYNSPLYKGSRKARGHSAVERGPNGQYKFISSGSDQRRSETSGPDGIVRGSYSYLDDKGMQRTVQYIAGAGIGYRIVKNTVGPLSHTLPRPALPDFGLDWTDTSNDLPESVASPKPSYPGTSTNDYDENSNNNSRSGNSFGDDDDDDEDTTTHRSSSDHSNRENNNDKKNDKPTIKGNREPEHRFNQGRGSTRDKPHTRYPTRNRDNTFFVPSKRNSDEDYGSKIDVRNNWDKKAEDSTLLTNVGDYYVGLPPGAIVRAHVQNIDLLPLGNRAPSPSDALRKDTEDD